MSVKRYLSAAQNAAMTISGILAANGLAARISRYVLTESERGDAWLFVVMDDSVSEVLDSSAASRVLAHLVAALQGHPVLFNNSFGLRYAVLLSSSVNL